MPPKQPLVFDQSSQKNHHIQRNFLFRLHFSSDLPLLWRCGRPKPTPESNQLDFELPKRDLRPELLLLLLFPDLRTTNLEIMPNWDCWISQRQSGVWFVVYLARQLVLFCFFFKRGQCFPCLLSKLQDFRKCSEVDKKTAQKREICCCFVITRPYFVRQFRLI